jgi:hypothetical protein
MGMYFGRIMGEKRASAFAGSMPHQMQRFYPLDVGWQIGEIGYKNVTYR